MGIIGIFCGTRSMYMSIGRFDGFVKCFSVRIHKTQKKAPVFIVQHAQTKVSSHFLYEIYPKPKSRFYELSATPIQNFVTVSSRRTAFPHPKPVCEARLSSPPPDREGYSHRAPLIIVHSAEQLSVLDIPCVSHPCRQIL